MLMRNITFLSFLIFSSTSFSSEALVNFRINKALYETGETSGGEQLSISGSVLLESKNGIFNRAKVNSSISGSSSPGNKDNSFLNFDYNIGKYWYPRATANDFSIWSGFGHWELNDYVGAAGSFERNARALYIPLGLEAGLPISYPTVYFIFGGEIRGVINSSLNVEDESDSSVPGFGYSAWAGLDYQFNSGTAIELRLSYNEISLYSSDYEYKSNQLSIGYRF